MKKRFFFFLSVVAASVAVIWGILSIFGPVTVKATNEGFSPNDVAIEAGQSVRFLSKTGKSIWPASDPHPVHTEFSAFDPGRPIAPGESWEFTFSEPGIYAFHDHLNVSSVGRIVVMPKGSDSSSFISEQCAEEGSEESPACFDARLKDVVRTSGVAAAFVVLSEKYDEGSVPSACHWSAHKIGEQAREEEKLGRPLEIVEETYYCGYGFYHGYLEALLREYPDPENQKELITGFCDEAQRQLGGEARDNCYHGIGSGYTEDPPEKRAWGDADLVVRQGLDICERLFGETREWEMCTTGVYAVPAKFMSLGLYGFSFDSEDPFKFCVSQEERLRRACYGEFAAKIEFVTAGDLSKVARIVSGIDDPAIAALVVNVGTSVMMQNRVLRNDNSDMIDGCDAFWAGLRPVCIDGIVWGFLYHGKIGEEHEKAIGFCESGKFSSDDRQFCYQRIAARSKNMFSSEKYSRICASFPESYRQYCAQDIPVQLY